MNNNSDEKQPQPKCADAIEFGKSFGKYSRLRNKQFALLFDETLNEEGFVYNLKTTTKTDGKFLVRILRPKPEGILLALWKTGKITFRSVYFPNKQPIIEVKVV